MRGHTNTHRDRARITRAEVGAHLNDLIDKAHMSDWVPLLHQDLLQMLHLENVQQRNGHSLIIGCAERLSVLSLPVCRQHISGPSVSPGWSTEQLGKLRCCLVWATLLCLVHLKEEIGSFCFHNDGMGNRKEFMSVSSF